MSDINKLKVYVKGLDHVTDIYKLVKNNSVLARDFSLSDQVKRAAVSVPCNISEDYLRSKRQFQHYLEIASGSANEVYTLLTIIEKVYKIDTNELKENYLYLGKQLISLSNSLNKTDLN